jgi:hypothetical protein
MISGFCALAAVAPTVQGSIVTWRAGDVMGGEPRHEEGAPPHLARGGSRGGEPR